MNALQIIILLFACSYQLDKQELESFFKNATNQFKNGSKQINPWDFLKDKLGKDVFGQFTSNNQTSEEDFIEAFFNTIAKYDKTIESDLTNYHSEDNQLITIIEAVPLVCKFTDNQHQLTRLIQKFTSIYKSKLNTSENDISDINKEIKAFLDDLPDLTSEQNTFKTFIYLQLHNLAALKCLIIFKENLQLGNNQDLIDEQKLVIKYINDIEQKNKITAIVESSLMKQYKQNQMNLPILCAMFSKIISILLQQREQVQLCNAYQQLLFYQKQVENNEDEVFIYKQQIFQSMKDKHNSQIIQEISQEINQLIQNKQNINLNTTNLFENTIETEQNNTFFEDSLLLKNEEEILQTNKIDFTPENDNKNLTTKELLILIGICLILLFIFIFALAYLIKMKPKVSYLEQPQKNDKNKIQLVESCAESDDKENHA